MDGEKERQGDFVFTANDAGDYKFCFMNDMSTYSEKFVDFEIAVEDEVRAQLPSKQGSSPEQTSQLEESIYKISGQLSTLTRNQKYFRTRENRNFATVRSTEGRIFNFSLIQCAMIIAMGGLQVFVVRFFFQVGLPQRASHSEREANQLGTGCPQGLRINECGDIGRTWGVGDILWRAARCGLAYGTLL